jgi:hypothetical protein
MKRNQNQISLLAFAAAQNFMLTRAGLVFQCCFLGDLLLDTDIFLNP